MERIRRRFARQTSSGRFIPELDGLRFVAIGWVFLFHLNGYLIVKSSNLYNFAQPYWLEQIAVVGFHGVELFFVISGFILGLPFAAHQLKGAKKVSMRQYYLRRLTRLEPPYIVAALLFFALAIFSQGQRFLDLYQHVAASLVYQHDLIFGTMSPIISVAWSLEIEVQFYLLVPLLALLFAIRPTTLRRGTICVLMLAVVGVDSLVLPGHPRLSLSLLAYLQYFLAGFLLSDIYLADWKQAPSRNFYWDLVSLVGWPLLAVVLHSLPLTHCLFPLLIFFLYCAAFRGTLLNRFFINPWVTAIGGMCYSIYLIHYQVISAVGRFTRPWSEGSPYWIHLGVQSVLVGAAVLVVCGLYFLVLEKPCMRPDWPQRLWRSLSGNRTSIPNSPVRPE
jgi:peptidoglycan/LPS O-acetylase OafA/YrhL